MTVAEIIEKVNEALQDSSITPVLADVNDAVAFIAAQAYLPELVTKGTATFEATSTTVADATNTSPVVITTSVDHPCTTGEIVVVTDVIGNTGANGTWYIEVLSNTTFSLLTSIGNGAYVSGGVAVRQSACVDMPSDYSHDLFEAFSISQGKLLTIRSNVKVMSFLYDENSRISGDVIDEVAVENNKLYSMPIGTDKDIVLCSYYRKPTPMILTSETISCIPEHLHEPIIVKYILSKKWPLIEDGLDGKAANTDRAIAELGGGIAALMQYYPRPSMAHPIIARHLHFF